MAVRVDLSYVSTHCNAYITRNWKLFIEFSQRRWLRDFVNCLALEEGIDMIFRNAATSYKPTDILLFV
jgi:hypothetical protein